MTQAEKERIRHYFSHPESRFFYGLWKGVKHFGFYPEAEEHISVPRAQQLMMDRVAEALDLSGGDMILDAGCGEGATAMHLAKNWNARVHGIDLLAQNIDKACNQARKKDLDDRVTFSEMNFQELAFEDCIFDGVFALESFVFASDYRRGLSEFWRVLKPGGRIAVFDYSTIPIEDAAQREAELAALVIQRSGMFSLRHFTHGCFPAMFEAAGFRQVAVRDITPRVLPMMRTVRRMIYLPYQAIKVLRLQKHFVNATAVVETYPRVLTDDVWRYNIITALKA